MPNRICVVSGKGGPLTVRLSTGNLLDAGARFILVDEKEEVRAGWAMQPGTDGVDEHPLAEVEPASLAGCYIKWMIRACSRHPAAESGTVRVEVLQDGAAAPMSPEASWTQAVPQCSGGTAFRVTDFCDLVVR